ncbi:MAG TPA: hypothetical protein VLA52_05715 [Thermohalobaculum sp.]|nr:hypothetical protein [Thermohalobaculum sp.]
MDKLSLRALLILAGAYILCFAVFTTQGVPMAAGGERTDSVFLATLLAGAYTLTSLAAIVFSRAVLGLFVDFSRPVAFFRALANVTDPFMALFAPLTPGFLHPAFVPFYTAFCLYFIKLLIFGGLGAPPILFNILFLILFAMG